MKKYVLILIFLSFFVSACSNVLPKIKAPLYVNSTGGLITIDLENLKVVGRPLSIGNSVRAVSADKDYIYISDSGAYPLKNGRLFVINRKGDLIKKIKAPGAMDLIITSKKIYGLMIDSLQFTYNKKDNKVETFDPEKEIKVIGFSKQQPVLFSRKWLIYKGKRISFAKEVSQSFVEGIDQGVVLEEGSSEKIALFIGESIFIINLKNFKTEKKIKPVLNPDYHSLPFAYRKKLYYSYGGKNYGFNKLAVLDLISGESSSIPLGAEPDNVIIKGRKLYFTVLSDDKQSNKMVIVDAYTNKIRKEISIGENSSGSMLIKNKLFIANLNSVVSVIDTDKDKAIKTIKLPYDPISFATPLRHSDAINLTLY